MKYALLFLVLQTTTNGALIWSSNFETDPVTPDNLEGQNADWLTDPAGTSSIAVFANTGLGVPASYGAQSLAIGGVAPVGETQAGVAYVVSPVAALFTPAGLVTEAVFSADMIFSSVGNLTNDFLFTFFNSDGTDLARLLFTAATDNITVAVYRSNTTAVTDTQFTFSRNTSVELKLVMNFELKKWTGTIGAAGAASPISLFANVDMTDPAPTTSDLDGFQVSWLKRSPTDPWGDNYLILDNLSLTSQVPVPEPSSLLLVCGFSLVALLRRAR
jgi:hypothetical protein